MALLFAAVILGLFFPYTARANAHDDYKELVVDIENEGPHQQIQLYRVDSNGDRITGICNVCSITTLLNRRLVYDGKTDEEFTVNDVFDACGVTVYAGPIYWNGNGKTGYRYSGDTGYWSRLRYTNDSGTSYQAIRVGIDQIRDGINETGSFNNYLIKLLHAHPEGICIRNEAANHVAVIYYYAIIDGRVQFYVKDPVERYSGKLEDAWIYNANGVHSLYNGIDFIVYLKGSKSAPKPDDSCRVFTAMSEGSSGSQVMTMQKMLKAVMDADMDVDGYFGPGTEKVLLQFQRWEGLDDDGICGQGTWAKLKEEYANLSSRQDQPPETTAAPKETEKSTEPKETEKSTEPKETEKSTEPKETEKSTEPKETEKSTESKETEKSTEPKETEKSTEPKETEKSTEAKETEKSTDADETEKGAVFMQGFIKPSFWNRVVRLLIRDVKLQILPEFHQIP